MNKIKEEMNKIQLVLSSVAMTLMIFTGCGDSNTTSSPAASCEIKKSANTVTIGSDVWMTENLNVDKFRNGDPIPQAKTYEEWFEAKSNGQPVWCYLNNDAANGEKYGKLYNWHAVSDPRGLAPEGWHIPSKDEWMRWESCLGTDVAGIKMKSTSGWEFDGNGTNESGFNGLAGGSVEGHESSWAIITAGMYGAWWSSTHHEYEEEGTAYCFNLRGGDELLTNTWSLDHCLSVRCVRD